MIREKLLAFGAEIRIKGLTVQAHVLPVQATHSVGREKPGFNPPPLLEPVQAGGLSSPSPNHGCTISDDKKIAWTRYERKEIYPL
jgi:hypothetical protein